MKNLYLILICTVVLFTSCSSKHYINSGWEKYNNSEYFKSKIKFDKAIKKGAFYDGYEGRAFSNVKLGDKQSAINDIQKTIESTNARYTYSTARIYAQLGLDEIAFNYLCYMYSKNGAGYYVSKSLNEYDFRNINNTERFKNYSKGFRRIKLEVLEAHSNWKEMKLGLFPSSQDPFCIVNATLQDGNKTLIDIFPIKM